ncbi:MAG: DUF389 domain-containing protein [Anaerolineales bacterium]|jgi:uncharacterized hydrophobic protein (TIGR00271 family)
MSLPEPVKPSLRSTILYMFRKIVKPVTLERRAEVQVQLRDSCTPDFDFFLLVLLSAVIATLGLLTNSAAVIIGAMLVAPLMSPIIGIGLASLTGDARLFRDSGVALVRGAFLAILMAVFLAWTNRSLPFVTLQDLPAEVLSRTRPSPIDLTIALAGGMAAAFALAMPSISAALPGVAIATALMPPLCTVGIGIAMGRWDVAGGAILLFLTNAVTIAFAGMLVFFALGFAPKREAGRRVPRALAISAVFTLILLVPLTLLSASFFRAATENRQIEAVVKEEVSKYDAELANMQPPVQNGDTLHLTITLRVPKQLRYEDVIQLQQDVALKLQRPVSIVVNQVVAARLDPLIPPTFTITPTAATFTPTVTFTPSATATLTPSPTPVPPTPTATPQLAQVPRNTVKTLDLVQQPGGPSIGKIRPGDFVTVLYSTKVYDGLVWWEVMDADGRLGWLPQISLTVVTYTPTKTVTPTP